MKRGDLVSFSLPAIASWGQQLTYRINQIKKLVENLPTPHIPDQILTSAADCLLHVSDTPALFYPCLFNLIKKIKPKVLIHTGDLVDQIKLENHPYLHSLYQEQIERLLPQLEHMPVDTIYLVPGNHDDTNIITYTCQRSCVLPESSVIEFGPFKLGVAHEPQHLPKGTDFGLYGHSLDQPSPLAGQPLSGLTNINILLTNGSIYSMPYPRGTDIARGIKIRPQKL